MEKLKAGVNTWARRYTVCAAIREKDEQVKALCLYHFVLF